MELSMLDWLKCSVNRIICFSIVAWLLVFGCLAGVIASPSLSTSYYKNDGYGLGNDIGGQWTINTDVSPDVSYVEFYVDEQLEFNDTLAPFSWSFNTNNYTLGLHTIRVIAFNPSGETATVVSNPNFVEYSATNFWLMTIVGVVIVLVVTLTVSLFRVRKKKLTKNVYITSPKKICD